MVEIDPDTRAAVVSLLLCPFLGSESLHSASKNVHPVCELRLCACVCVCVCRLTLKEQHLFLPECCELSLCPIYKSVTNKVLFSRQSDFPAVCRLVVQTDVEIHFAPLDIFCHIRPSGSEQPSSELGLRQEHHLLSHVYLPQPFFLC